MAKSLPIQRREKLLRRADGLATWARVHRYTTVPGGRRGRRASHVRPKR